MLREFSAEVGERKLEVQSKLFFFFKFHPSEKQNSCPPASCLGLWREDTLQSTAWITDTSHKMSIPGRLDSPKVKHS